MTAAGLLGVGREEGEEKRGREGGREDATLVWERKSGRIERKKNIHKCIKWRKETDGHVRNE